jgi:hypothetical protein
MLCERTGRRSCPRRATLFALFSFGGGAREAGEVAVCEDARLVPQSNVHVKSTSDGILDARTRLEEDSAQESIPPKPLQHQSSPATNVGAKFSRFSSESAACATQTRSIGIYLASRGRIRQHGRVRPTANRTLHESDVLGRGVQHQRHASLSVRHKGRRSHGPSPISIEDLHK